MGIHHRNVGAITRHAGLLSGLLLCSGQLSAAAPRLGEFESRFQQSRFDQVPPLSVVRQAGLVLFATPFNHADSYGDGPINPDQTLSFGGRPTLGNNGTFLRINGLDGQSCVDCHARVSSATVPPTFGVADSTPYLHDGRALSLSDAINCHGGEAQLARNRFAALSEGASQALLRFLKNTPFATISQSGRAVSPLTAAIRSDYR